MTTSVAPAITIVIAETAHEHTCPAIGIIAAAKTATKIMIVKNGTKVETADTVETAVAVPAAAAAAGAAAEARAAISALTTGL